MIYKTSFYLTYLLQKKGIISKSQTEIYEYGFQITIANIVNFTIALFIGIMFHSLIEVALFYGVFVSLRFYCGGYHANSYEKCFVLFAITNILCLYGSRILSNYENLVNLSFLMIILWLGWCVWKKAPIEHKNRPLSSEERIVFRRRAIEVYCFWTGFGIALWVFGSSQLVANLISTFIAISILMFTEEGESKDGEENA